MGENKFYIYISLFVFLLSGCATVPTKVALPTYALHGTTYVPLVALCNLRDINLEYDTYSKTVSLSRGARKIDLLIGDTLILVDGAIRHLKYPVDFYQGTVVVHYKFNEQVLDAVFEGGVPVITRASSSLAQSRIKKIVIDAGHGGNDPGAIGKSGLREKDANLDIAKRLSSLLRAEGAEVVMTRVNDSLIPLARRVELTNESNADLFISVHCNANRVRSVDGLEIYYISEKADDDQRALLSAKDLILGLDSSCFYQADTDVRAIVWDMVYNYCRSQSIELAKTLRASLILDAAGKTLRLKGANFYVLKGVHVPAVLVETGYLSNPKEEKMLKNGYYRQGIAEAIVRGIKNYVKHYKLMEVAEK